MQRFEPGLLLTISLGGAAGTAARAAIDRALPAGGSGFPWATWTVNVVGSLVIGLVVVAALERAAPGRYLRPLVGTGFCGGLTTFSTFAVETDRLLRAGSVWTAVLYVAASLAAGLLAVAAGAGIARAVINREEI
ncbi:MAG TPA: fluoride efflux transporter CrcB [Acidimicrobiales bacterium]|nr:fluoride efflux transporter CrcB [Acidimicrobiales bacterium]